MTNIPYIAIISFLFIGIDAFRVLPVNEENPDLVIDEELNLVEPKKDLWNILLRPKAKTSFKSILKMLNSFNVRDRYSVGEKETPTLIHQSAPNSPDIIVVKKDEVTVKKGQEQFLLSNRDTADIVSEELPNRESLSEEHPIRIAVGSISVESEEKSDDSNQSPKTSKINSSQESESSKESLENDSSSQPAELPKAEKLTDHEPVGYTAGVPKSLHNYERNRPRFQHSFRYGWTY